MKRAFLALSAASLALSACANPELTAALSQRVSGEAVEVEDID